MIYRFEKFVCAITEIDLYWHRLASAEMKHYGQKGNYAIYFTKLKGYPDGVTSATLASVCGKDKADVSRDISVLEKGGFVKRIKIDGNAYRAKIILTEKGHELTDKIIKRVEQAVECVGSDLPRQDRECFYRVLSQITQNLHSLSESGLPEPEDDESSYMQKEKK